MENAIGIWILLFLTHSSTSINPPDSNGCNRENTKDCIYNLYCLNEINDGIDLYNNNNFNYNYNRRQYSSDNNCFVSNGYYYYRLYVTYKGQGDEVPKGNGQILKLIERLDLSSNQYNVSPTLRAMNRLSYLNLSRNYLTTAKLYNIYELPNLEELDLSYNNINTIQVGHSNIFNKLHTLNLSHNYLVTIPNAIFSDFTELLTLDLSHNFINILGVPSFEGLKKLTFLYLSHNQLPEVNGALFRFTKLQKLDLSHNKLGEIKYHDFEILQEITDLNLSHNLIESIESSTFSNMNLLQSLKLCNNNLQDISKINFANNSNLDHFDISQNNLKCIPRYMFKGKTISFIDITGNNLEGALSVGIFEGLGRVTKLDLSKQQLTGLEDSAFHGLDNINELLLNKNKLRAIANESFISLIKLTILDLSDNHITDLHFDTTDLVNLHLLILGNNIINQTQNFNFQAVNALNFLDLSNNKISKLDPMIFKSLHKLTNLNVSGNPLNKTLETATFDGLISLPKLDISDTHLTTIQNGSFAGMVELKILKISHNKLVELQCNSFIGLSNVDTIDLSYNQLKTLEINWNDLVNLKEILISQNFLKAITSNTFIGLTGLTKLDLSHNNVISIHNEAFDNLRHLRYLDISENENMAFNVSFIRQNKELKEINLSGLRCKIQLMAISATSLSHLEMSNSNITNITSLNLKSVINLQFLILSYNNIKIIDYSAFSNLKNLETIDLSFNNISLIQPGAFKDNEYLQKLNISHNSLTTVSYGALSGLLNLYELDLSYNTITVIDSERFYEVPSLRVLVIDNNNINSISTEEFAGISLEELSLGGNFIPCEILVNFKKSVSYKISAINKNVSNKENVNGITCTTENLYKTDQNQGVLQSDREILSDIRDTLHKIENKNIHPAQSADSSSYVLSNISQEVQKLANVYDNKLSALINHSSMLIKHMDNSPDQLVSIKESVNSSNQLLEKILMSLNQKPLVKNVSNFDDIIQYIDNIRNVIENNMYRKIDEIEKKIGIANSYTTSTTRAIQENLLAERSIYDDGKTVKETRPAIFTNICLGLILMILICFILYKVYKSRKSIRRGWSSYSTRELPTSMETPEL